MKTYIIYSINSTGLFRPCVSFLRSFPNDKEAIKYANDVGRAIFLITRIEKDCNEIVIFSDIKDISVNPNRILIREMAPSVGNLRVTRLSDISLM